ncbi:hypothetical protein ASA1KI_39600 [Opitutales bacterium ASA1]|uniref:hypothetical protein n=1 Tax=Congregicoccus parvus TaxID=3081749 RepID=UPI002B2FEE70|nr:hypothetical protein ASA1KI_39600 [Opitutales bacterium ASA1]
MKHRTVELTPSRERRLVDPGPQITIEADPRATLVLALLERTTAGRMDKDGFVRFAALASILGVFPGLDAKALGIPKHRFQAEIRGWYDVLVTAAEEHERAA